MSKQPPRRRATELAGTLPLEVFRALADPTRAAVVAWLAGRAGPTTVSQVVESGCCSVDFSVVSRHLQTLKDAGVLESQKQGREVLYRLRGDALVRTLRALADGIESCCAPPKPHSKKD